MKILLSSLIILVVSGCSSNKISKIPPISSNLVLDVKMPIYGTNEKIGHQNFQFLDTISVSIVDEEFKTNSYNNFSDNYSWIDAMNEVDYLKHALAVEAGKLGANSIIDVTTRKENFIRKGKFGSIIKIKTIMTGKAVFNQRASKCVNTVMLDALYHKNKDLLNANRLRLYNPNYIENGDFWLSPNNDLVVRLEKFSFSKQQGLDIHLSVSEQEIMDFKNNESLTYRAYPSGVKVEN
jgi:hypothetical protein